MRRWVLVLGAVIVSLITGLSLASARQPKASPKMSYDGTATGVDVDKAISEAIRGANYDHPDQILRFEVPRS
jgi:hypothetical protein